MHARTYVHIRHIGHMYVCMPNVDPHDAEEGQETDSSIGPKNSFITKWSERRRHYVFATVVRARPRTGHPPRSGSPSDVFVASTRGVLRRDVSAASGIGRWQHLLLDLFI